MGPWPCRDGGASWQLGRVRGAELLSLPQTLSPARLLARRWSWHLLSPRVRWPPRSGRPAAACRGLRERVPGPQGRTRLLTQEVALGSSCFVGVHNPLHFIVCGTRCTPPRPLKNELGKEEALGPARLTQGLRRLGGPSVPKKSWGSLIRWRLLGKKPEAELKPLKS